eukprot:5427129-Prymnesium_polylepis.1
MNEAEGRRLLRHADDVALPLVMKYSTLPRSKINNQHFLDVLEMARVIVSDAALLRSAEARLWQAQTLEKPLLQVLEREESADKLAPLLETHKVHTLQEFAGLRRARLVRDFGLTEADAATLHVAASIEWQLSQGCSIATAIVSHKEVAGHTEYQILSTAVAPGGRQAARTSHRMTDFCRLHEQFNMPMPPFPFKP